MPEPRASQEERPAPPPREIVHGTPIFASGEYLAQMCAALDAEREKSAALREALAKLSQRLEREIADDGIRIWWLPDNACAECIPDGEMVKPGFQCARHAALRLTANPEAK